MGITGLTETEPASHLRIREAEFAGALTHFFAETIHRDVFARQTTSTPTTNRILFL
jgi:hypothetical protein